MTAKTKKSDEHATNAQQTRDEHATNARRTRDEQVTNARRTGDEQVTNAQQTGDERAANRALFVPIMEIFRSYLRKDVANSPQIWLPIETNLIFRYEFAACSIQTRYIFVAILLYCGQRGIDVIPDDKRFLASCLNADARTIEKALPELENFGLLLERKKERKIRKEQTDRKKENADAGVSVSSENLSKTVEENGDENRGENPGENPVDNEADKQPEAQKSSNNQQSSFSLDECKRYVEAEIKDGAPIQNAAALAMKLFRTGEADSFIKAKLYPERHDREQFGEPRRFSLDACTVCFGAKMADTGGRGYRPCGHCVNEKGKSTGYEPEPEKNDD